MVYAANCLIGSKIIYPIEVNVCSLEPPTLVQRESSRISARFCSWSVAVFDLCERYYRITTEGCKAICG